MAISRGATIVRDSYGGPVRPGLDMYRDETWRTAGTPAHSRMASVLARVATDPLSNASSGARLAVLSWCEDRAVPRQESRNHLVGLLGPLLGGPLSVTGSTREPDTVGP